MQRADEYFTNEDPRLATRDRIQSVKLKDYFMKRFQSALPKPALKTGPLEIEMKTFDKNNPFPYPRDYDREDYDTDTSSLGDNRTSESNVADFLDNLEELYKDLCLIRKQKQQFLNLLTYFDNLLVILSTSQKSSGDRSIQIVDTQFKEDNFMIMLMSLGYEIIFWSENKVLLNISTEPSKEFLSLASNAIRSQYLQNPQFLPQSRSEPAPTVVRRSEPARTPAPQTEAEKRASFLASKHEQRLNKMSTANTGNANTNTNSYNRDTRQNRNTDFSYMNNQVDDYRDVMRSKDGGPGYYFQNQQQSYTQQPEQTPQYNNYQNDSTGYDTSSEDERLLYGLSALELTNEFRGNKGAPLLEWCQELYEIGMEHSQAMAEGRIPFSHLGFDQRRERIRYSRDSIAENVAISKPGTNPAETAVKAWINSDAHRSNLLSKSNVCGVAGYRAANGTWYFTQIFARR